jgi:hypothetical protein
MDIFIVWYLFCVCCGFIIWAVHGLEVFFQSLITVGCVFAVILEHEFSFNFSFWDIVWLILVGVGAHGIALTVIDFVKDPKINFNNIIIFGVIVLYWMDFIN